ncbi:MAG: Crp/Fnr family transcriptional regulator [Rhizobiaceae bacterium]|nr:MAG: Crp/Fnr family transcriptional regulator [Rhizobiaceae bacterium]CAG0954489.1 Acetyltransferase Pat [Rhizobiaceae bacterium]
MALEEDVRILSGVRLFDGFTQEQLRLLAFGGEAMRLPERRVLYREGDEADCAFVIVDGAVDLSQERDGRRVPVRRVGPGTILGELALIADSNRMTDATTAADTALIRLGRKQFRKILEEFPDLAVLLHDRIAEELQRMIAEIERQAPRFAG